MFPKSFLSTILLGVAALPLAGQTTQIDAQYLDDFAFAGPPTNPILDEEGIALDAGTDAAGDGDIFQIGYFAGVATGTDVSTFGDSEWATFTPLSSADGRYLTTIGDAGGISGNVGIFSVALTLDPAIDTALPSSYPVRLGIRFFNDGSIDTSTHYNTMTSNEVAWMLSPPNVPPPLPSYLNLDDTGATFVWQSGPGGEFQTALLLMPEPSTMTLVLLGALLGFTRRRRK